MLDSEVIAFESLHKTAQRRRPAIELDPVEIYNGAGQAPLLIICDHAGHHMPARYASLGLPQAEIRRHIGWDIGAADMTRRIADLLDAPAVLNHASRLIIDPNRLPHTASSVPALADGTLVPGNQGLNRAEINERLRYSFLPYHRAVARQIARLRRRHGVPALISMHSFTPQLRVNGTPRPWQVGVLWDRDGRLAAPVLASLRRRPNLCVGDNEPYAGNAPEGYSLPFHAIRSGLPNILFEVRQDLIETPARAESWAELLAELLRPPLSDPTLYRSAERGGQHDDAATATLFDDRSRRRVLAG